MIYWNNMSYLVVGEGGVIKFERNVVLRKNILVKVLNAEKRKIK